MGVPRPVPTAWLRAHAHPLATCEPTNDFTDLAPLRSRLGAARVVALGEATHGTHEFFTLKHRLIRFLVQELGFTLVAFEASWSEAERLNRYVQTGTGDPADLLVGLGFWTWNTQEVLDLIHWLRRHNAVREPGASVRFGGFDAQYPRRALTTLLGYLDQVDPSFGAHTARAVMPFLRNLTDLTPYLHNRVMLTRVQVQNIMAYQRERARTRAVCRRGLQRAVRRLKECRNAYEARSSTSAFAEALRSTRVAMMGEMLYADWPPLAGPRPLAIARAAVRYLVRTRLGRIDDRRHRDALMAELATALVDEVGATGKVVLWAHNGHISTRPRTMGMYLRERFGSELVTVGFAFGEGAFHAQRVGPSLGEAGPLQIYHVPAPIAHSYEAGFRRVGGPQWVLDLRTPPDDEATRAWLAGPRPMRMIGALYDAARAGRFMYPARLTQEYDVVVYVDRTTPSRLLP